MPQQHHCREAACLLAAVVVDGCIKYNYSRYSAIGYMPTNRAPLLEMMFK